MKLTQIEIQLGIAFIVAGICLLAAGIYFSKPHRFCRHEQQRHLQTTTWVSLGQDRFQYTSHGGRQCVQCERYTSSWGYTPITVSKGFVQQLQREGIRNGETVVLQSDVAKEVDETPVAFIRNFE
ncbi:MAG: hypothetical protein V3W44_05130 [Dehalococcoidales bacterium]